MKDIKHTPGPWKTTTQTHWSGGAPYSESVYVTIGEETLTIGCHTGTPNQEILTANAKLIAAAPDLLEALIGVVAIADRATVEFDKAKAAIAKATLTTEPYAA